MNIKENLKYYVLIIILAIFLVGSGYYTYQIIENYQSAQVMKELVHKINPDNLYVEERISDGYAADSAQWWKDLLQLRTEAKGQADKAINTYGNFLSEEDRAALRTLEKQMTESFSIIKIKAFQENFDNIVSKAKQEKAKQEKKQNDNQATAYNANTNYNSGGGCLTRSGGVFYFNGHRETWYSQRVLPGNGLNIPGRHVDSNGLVKDQDGYIVVASCDYSKGTIVQTSLGAGKVYDYCSIPGTIDIYTNW